VHCFGKLIVLTILAVTGGGTSIADEVNADRVELRFSTKLVAPNLRSSGSGSVIAEIGAGYEWKIDIGNYELHFLVEDRRDREFSIRLDLLDQAGAVVDSTTILASETDNNEFALSSGDVALSGTVRVGR